MSTPEMRNISDIPVTTAYLFRLFCGRQRAHRNHEARPLSLLITWFELEIVEMVSFVDDTFSSLDTYASLCEPRVGTRAPYWSSPTHVVPDAVVIQLSHRFSDGR